MDTSLTQNQTLATLERLLPSWPFAADPFLIAAALLILAAVSGEVFSRVLRLPRITGYSLAGLIAGPAGLDWISGTTVPGSRLLIDLALTLLLFELGIRVNLRWLRQNPAILVSSIGESAIAFGVMYVTVLALGFGHKLALATAAIATCTSPAVVMRMATELRARGQVTERMLLLTALNTVYAVVLVYFVLGAFHQHYGAGWTVALLHPLYLLFGSFVVAALLALTFLAVRRYFEPSDEQASAILFGLLLLTAGTMHLAKLPALLAPLMAGMLVRLMDPRPHLWPRHFGTAGGFLVIVLFVMTGSGLTWDYIVAGGFAALALIAARFFGKLIGATLLAGRSGLDTGQSLALGVALCPMSGVAFVLTDDISRIHPVIGAKLGAIVLSMVVVLEFIGPIAVQWALRWTGEAKGPNDGA
jgi:Kef-type K+ transport system membrane component KefB